MESLGCCWSGRPAAGALTAVTPESMWVLKLPQGAGWPCRADTTIVGVTVCSLFLVRMFSPLTRHMTDATAWSGITIRVVCKPAL